jgi:hypothetical protein
MRAAEGEPRGMVQEAISGARGEKRKAKARGERLAKSKSKGEAGVR